MVEAKLMTAHADFVQMWAGYLADIPLGWALCDGQGGRPDLRSKFIKGAPAGQEPGATGGAPTHGHADHLAGVTGVAGVGATQRGTTASTLTLKAHTHTTPALTHSTESNEPEYYTLAFIIKI